MMTRILLFLFVFGVTPAFAVDVASPCRAIDFSSYFIAQNAKSNILELNPDLSHPNFNGKYLLLRNEMLAETLYLIADCTTGTFFHEKLHAPNKGSIEFHLQSALVTIHQQDKDEFQIWKDGEWIQVEKPSSKAAPTAEPVKPVTQTGYEAEFARFPGAPALSSCKPLKFDSYFRAQQSKDSILGDHPYLSHPNFAGKYLLLKASLLFETTYLIADCESGLFYPEVLKGEAHFTPKSRFVWVSHSSEFPDTLVWDAPEWVAIHDPHRATPPPIHHILNREQSEALIQFIRRDRKDSILRQDELDCDSNCVKSLPWMKLRGSYFTHLVCDVQKISCTLDAEVKGSSSESKP